MSSAMQPISKQPPSKSQDQVTLEDCLLILLRGIQNHSIVADESAGQEFRKELAALEGKFTGEGKAHQLVDSAVEVLDKYGTQTNQVVARHKSAIVATASELNSAIKALPGMQGAAERLNKVEEQIKAISPQDNLELVKARVHADFAMARVEALQERQGIIALLSGIVSRLQVSPGQLPSETSQLAGPVHTPDRLTGLPSRAYAEEELARAHAQFPDCHLVLFVVKRVALINAKFGYSRGDQVLMKVVQILAQSLPEFKSLFRWAPCAFLAVAPPKTSFSDLRSKVQVIELTRINPTIEWEGRSAIVPVVIDCRIVSVKDFGTPSELFLRLDTLSSDV
jgi:GGDEF domain-containing protein